MAVFVDNFVMDSFNIILNEEIVPTFWEHFSQKVGTISSLRMMLKEDREMAV